MLRTNLPHEYLHSDYLYVADVPADDAPLSALHAFAHTFDGYAHWGSLKRCAEIANDQDHTSLDKLRTCLFFEARRWRHFGESPHTAAEEYSRLIVTKIRHHIQEKAA